MSAGAAARAGAGWRLRVARAEDAGEVLVLTRAAFLSVGQHVGDLHLPPLAEPLDAVAAALADPSTVVLVAEALDGGGLGRPGRLVGAVRLLLHDGVSHLGRLAVAPDAQRRGIAAALVAAAEDAAAAAGAARVELFTGHGQVGALALYRGRGYEDVEPPTRGPGAGLEHLVHLARPLVPDGAGAAVRRTT